ncbi:hypothetical protein [Flindersiella endophytica]
MTKLLLSIHVLAAILAVGPVAVAASMFPAALRRADSSLTIPRSLHRICRVYATVGVAVPVFGLATASSLGVLTDAWLLISIGLTTAAAAVLGLLVLPGQRSALAGGPAAAGRLAMYTGTFNLLWAVVTVLMIIRPGSTTGA